MEQEEQEQQEIQDLKYAEYQLEDSDKEEIQNEEDDIIEEEIEVIYVPIDYQLFITQYPLRSKYNDEFEHFLEPVTCDYKPKQKKFNINFAKTDKFTNTKMDLTSQGNTHNEERDMLFIGDHDENDMQKKLQQQKQQNQDELQQKYQVSYTSKLINNKLTYFVSHYDKQSNKIYLFPVDSFQQMRPIIKSKETRATKTTPTDIKKISREIERDKNLLQKHPEKYVENRLRYHVTFDEIYNSEQYIHYKYKDLSKQRSVSANNQPKDKLSQQYIPQNPLVKTFPENILNLQYSSKETFINKLENNNLQRRPQQQN